MSEPPAYLDPRDPAVHLDQHTQRYIWEGAEKEWEWHGRLPEEEERQTSGRWIEVISQEEINKQQEVYSVAGVDETVPAAPVIKRQQGKKRKEPEPSAPKKPKPNTAVFVSQLPLDAEASEIAEVFSRYGVLLENEEGQPRIKLYHDSDTGAFKGEALVVYFKPESVELAVQLLDDTYLRASKGVCTGSRMHVERAHFQSEPGADTAEKKPRELSEAERKSLKKRMSKMNSKTNDWDSDSDTERPKVQATARTLILKKMFTLAELDEDATLLLDLKQDVREECESLGQVTNVVLWDREPEGVITVRFRDPAAAQRAYAKMDGRYFAGRQIVASLTDARPKFRKTAHADDENEEDDERRRADAFGDWLDGQGEGDK